MKLKRVNSTNKKPEIIEKPKYTNLREIMDYSKPFSMFFSGVENKTYFEGCVNMGVSDFLMSYHYLQGSDLHTKFKGMNIKVFIDSGAYTYQADPKYLNYTPEQWEKQIVRYLKWAEKNRDYIFAIANLDLENLLGVDIVRGWNEKYFEPFMLRTGIPVCFIWHQIDSDNGWERYCQRYPYVGMSWVSDDGTDIDFTYGVDKLKTAEKYNTLVHGMGMTRTSILPQLPFYTVDSTSWKSGFRYGQVAIWNGKKVQLKSKEDFHTKVFPVLENYKDIDPPLDLEKIENFYEPEILRCNVYAYLKAEEYIRQQLRPLTYWQKAKSIVRDSIDDIVFPSVNWCNRLESQEDWEKYAEQFNVSKEDREVAINCICDITMFLNWDDPERLEYRDAIYKPELIKSIHDQWINRIVATDEERIKDLKEFFLDNVLGKNTTLLYLGTNFDRIVKERDEKDYITEDDEYDMQDVSEMEVINKLSNILPPSDSAPEISELDDEIFRDIGIVPVRDAQGKFLKGQRAVAKPKKLYSKKYPKLACDTCFNAQKCPQYKAGYACAYNKMFERFNTRDMGDIIQAMQGIVDFSLVRLQRGMLTETLGGGIPDPSVTNMMNQTMGYLSQLQRMYEYGGQEVLRQTKIMRSDGTQEITTQVSNPQQGGILEKIFGDMKSQTEEKKEDSVVEEPK